MKRLVAGVMVLSFILLPGCSPFVEKNITEEISPVLVWYLDEGTDGGIRISTIMPPVVREDKKLLNLQVDLVKQANRGFNLKYYRELKNGQLRMLIMNEKLARKGILNKVSTMIMDPEISQRLYVVIVKGDFEKYMREQLRKYKDFDYFLYRMLMHYEKQGDITVTNLHQFLKDFYSIYTDPVAPIFKVHDENFEYDGTGYFHGDKLIGTIQLLQDQYFQLLSNNQFIKFLTVPSLDVTIGIVRSAVNMRFSEDYNSVFFKVKLDGRLEEYRGAKDVSLEKEKSKLIDDLKIHFENETTALLKKIQKSKSDPLKIGVHTLTPFSRPFTDQEWEDKWEHMKIHVDFQLNLDVLQ
jgi:spore germination protein